jgi:hypothetical protein
VPQYEKCPKQLQCSSHFQFHSNKKSPGDCCIISSLDGITVSGTILAGDFCLRAGDFLWLDDFLDGDCFRDVRLGDFSVRDGDLLDRRDGDFSGRAGDFSDRRDEDLSA